MRFAGLISRILSLHQPLDVMWGGGWGVMVILI